MLSLRKFTIALLAAIISGSILIGYASASLGDSQSSLIFVIAAFCLFVTFTIIAAYYRPRKKPDEAALREKALLEASKLQEGQSTGVNNDQEKIG